MLEIENLNSKKCKPNADCIDGAQVESFAGTRQIEATEEQTFPRRHAAKGETSER